MKIAWFSCGITSAVACKLAVEEYGADNVMLIYIGIKSAHPDNDRFIKDCERWIGKEIEYRQSAKYEDQFDVIKKTKYINGPMGARCTLELKKMVRWSVEESVEFDGQIFGFEFEKNQINRAIRFAQQHHDSKPLYPLIDKRLTKEMCADILLKNGIALPVMYELGFHNNNCIGCVKGGKGYWNKIRNHFPNEFDKMAKLERKVGNSCVNGVFLDELDPNDGRHLPPIVPECGTFCEIEFADIIDPETEAVYSGLKKISQLKLF